MSPLNQSSWMYRATGETRLSLKGQQLPCQLSTNTRSFFDTSQTCISCAMAASPNPPSTCLISAKVVTSVYWAWLSGTDLFLPSKPRKTFPAWAQIHMQLQYPVKLACACLLTCSCFCPKQYLILEKWAMESHKTATLNHNIYWYYHKEKLN